MNIFSTNLPCSELSETIKIIRSSAGLTQAELARELSVSTLTVNRYENGKRVPGTGFLARLVKKFPDTARAAGLTWENTEWAEESPERGKPSGRGAAYTGVGGEGPVDPERLAACLVAIREEAKRQHKALSVEKEALAAAMLYRIAEIQRDPEKLRTEAGNIIRLAA